MIVVDASALLAFLQGEPGAERVEEALEKGALCSAANWSEVAQKILQARRNWELAATLLLSYDLTIESVTREDAETAAILWTHGDGLSLGDRLCLALAHRLDAPALTADARWSRLGQADPPVEIIQIR